MKEAAMTFDFQVNLSVSMKRKMEFLIYIELKVKREDHSQRASPISSHQNVTPQLSWVHHFSWTSPGEAAGAWPAQKSPRASEQRNTTGTAECLWTDLQDLCPLILQTLKNVITMYYIIYYTNNCISGCFITKQQHDSFHETFPSSAQKIYSAAKRFPLLPTHHPSLTFNPYRWKRWDNLP